MALDCFLFFDFMGVNVVGVDEGDRWLIKKTLKNSDVGGLSRLSLSREVVEQYIMPHLDEESRRRIEHGEKIPIMIYDVDTGTRHNVKFTKWLQNKMYNIQQRWTTDFVSRRSLKKGDEIGMCWDEGSSSFHFRVLKRGSCAYGSADSGKVNLELSLDGKQWL